jgi:hypothetical protein
VVIHLQKIFFYEYGRFYKLDPNPEKKPTNSSVLFFWYVQYQKKIFSKRLTCLATVAAHWVGSRLKPLAGHLHSGEDIIFASYFGTPGKDTNYEEERRKCSLDYFIYLYGCRHFNI